jgi:hypothetical protein
MKHLGCLSVALVLAIPAAVNAAPPWGANCLSCHSAWQENALNIFGEDTIEDPDETGTGAPDRGPLPVFQVIPGEIRALQVEVMGLAAEDSYAVELRRLRSPGVVNAGRMVYTGDCTWPEWGDNASYFTDPFLGYKWGSGPTLFVFDLDVDITTPYDYYDLVFAVAGRRADGTLFCGEEHFYCQAVTIPGDLDQDRDVDLTDFTQFEACISGPDNTTAPAGCAPQTFQDADLDGDGDVDAVDFTQFARRFTN